MVTENQIINAIVRMNEAEDVSEETANYIESVLLKSISPPASAEEEAARLYPYYTLETVREMHDANFIDNLRAVHITCAGMYTGEIEKLRNALQHLVDAVPKQQANVDWWDDSMTTAMKQAQELLK